MNRPTMQALRVNLEQDSVLHRITNRIRRSLELNEILAATAAEVRSLLSTDRVKIYKFQPDGSGQVVAESIQENRLPSLFGLTFPAGDIPPHARELFVKSRVRSVINVSVQEIGHSHLEELEDGETRSEDIRYRLLDPCHLEYLTAMGVKSSVAVPIFHQERLWGLLVSHHSEPRDIPNEELQLLQGVVDQLSVAIAHADLLAQAQEKARRQASLNRINSFLHSSTTIALQPALEETIAAFGGTGGRLCVKADAYDVSNGTVRSFAECLQNDSVQVYTWGKQPQMPELARYPLMEQYSVWQEHYKTGNYDIWAVSDIFQDDALRNLQCAFYTTKIRSLLMIPLQYRQELFGYLSIFRDEFATETLWAGRVEDDKRQLYPQISFEVWRNAKRLEIPKWSESELELGRSLGGHFSTAIYQYEMRHQLQTLNANLESQVQERTAKLLEAAEDMQRAAEQQRVLFKVVAKMRDSLNLETIFQTTTQEVGKSLQADRVVVYRFYDDWSGEFIHNFEFVTSEWNKLVSLLDTRTVWADTCLQETCGGRFSKGETLVVDDVYQFGHAPCYVEALEKLQVKAYVIAPIFVGQKLWGLLTAYQHSDTRRWKTLEVEFFTQVATQLGVAIQQADLLTQTQSKTQQLSQALQDLQSTQTQLIQTEKMSSLGQLVAGVAHEINNPVNFIHGNIEHITEHTEDLLSLLQLYQQHYPNPKPEIAAKAKAVDVVFLTEDVSKILNSMKVGTDRICQIVQSLKIFSRLDRAEVREVDIHEGVDSTLMILQHRLKADGNSPGIKVSKEYGNLPFIECYPGQLNQVFMNLLSNAIDALDEKNLERSPQERQTNSSLIHIRTEALAKDWVAIRIIDNGIGMSEEVRCCIFDPFFSTKSVGKGTGLGLSISYQIVLEKHGGNIKCLSVPGKGTEFRIEIPIRLPVCSQS